MTNDRQALIEPGPVTCRDCGEPVETEPKPTWWYVAWHGCGVA